jgi:hypothetical protein
MPNHYVGDLLHIIGMSGLSRLRTELVRLTVIAALPHPVQMHRQLPSHCYLGDLPPLLHGQVGLGMLFRNLAHDGLERSVGGGKRDVGPKRYPRYVLEVGNVDIPHETARQVGTQITRQSAFRLTPV